MSAPVDELRPAGYRWLIGFTAGVAAVTFVLSFHGLDGYGRHLAGIPWYLAWLVPVGVDGLTLCGVAATFLLRHAALHVRAYAWLVFSIAVGLSVAGNVLDAAARHVQAYGLAGAAAWPILLALASHLVVVTRRAMDRTAAGRGPDPALTGTLTDQPEQPAADTPDETSLKLPAAAVKVAKVRARTPKATQEQVARKAGVSVTTVKRHWPATAPEPAPRNGHAVPALITRED